MLCWEDVWRQSYSTLGLQIDDKMVYLELSSTWLLVSNLSRGNTSEAHCQARNTMARMCKQRFGVKPCTMSWGLYRKEND